jgi:hypothetical protein
MLLIFKKFNLPTNYNNLSAYERRLVRDQYTEEQNGLCMYCNQPLTLDPPKSITDKPINWDLFPPNFLKYPVHLQHCHNTGMTEGAVHAYCNAVMWQYEGK